MHKLKQAFGKKDDNTHTNAATGDNVEPERRRSSIMRQILNPGGDKYEEEIHGTTSTATPAVANPEQLPPNPDVKLATQPEKEKGHGVLRQILNPGGDKYDEERHGITAVPADEVRRPGELETDPAKDHQDKKSHGIARQIFNPNGEKYTEESFGNTAYTVPESSDQHATPALPGSSGPQSGPKDVKDGVEYWGEGKRE